MDTPAVSAARQAWINGFVKYVVDRVHGASPVLLARRAERLYPHLGSYGPIEVAEAEWDELPLPPAASRGIDVLK
jgi:hypothetical protein